jgi:hypothetical protein
MNPPIVSLIEAATPQITELGSPARIFPDMIPQGQLLPAVMYTVVSGAPENYLEAPPTLDSIVFQINVWAHTGRDAQDIADRVRVCLEDGGRNCCIRLNPGDFDPDTKRFNVSFDFEFWLSR